MYINKYFIYLDINEINNMVKYYSQPRQSELKK
jgi:hypothetical protein